MVTVMFISAWGAHEARTVAEVTDSQAESLLSVGVAVRVDPDPIELSADPPLPTARQSDRRKPPPPIKAKIQRLA